MKAILFDLDDTLYDRAQPFLEAFHDFFGERYKDLAHAAYKACNRCSFKALADFQNGLITREVMQLHRYGGGLLQVGITIDQEEAIEIHRLYTRAQKRLVLSACTSDMLDFCCEHYAYTGIITNGEAGHQREKLEVLGLDRWFPADHILISGELGILKPDRRIFEEARRRAGTETMVFVGDSYEVDIVGAHEAGWRSVWFDRADRRMEGSYPAADHTVATEEELSACVREMV